MSDIHSTEKVRYAAIPGFPGYRVGTDGSVWSSWYRKFTRDARGVANGAKCHTGGPWKKLRSSNSNKYGHQRVGLTRNGKVKCYSVHKLVIEAFRGPCPKGKECAHENGNPRDNRLENLVYKTEKENQQDRVKHGTDMRGSKHHNHVLTESDIPKIIAMRAEGMIMREIGDVFGVSRSAIGDLLRWKSWKHLKKKFVNGTQL